MCLCGSRVAFGLVWAIFFAFLPVFPPPCSPASCPLDPLARRKPFGLSFWSACTWPERTSQSLGMFIVASSPRSPLFGYFSLFFFCFVAKYKRQLVFMPTPPSHAPAPKEDVANVWLYRVGRGFLLSPFFCVCAGSVVTCMNMKWSYNPHQTTKWPKCEIKRRKCARGGAKRGHSVGGVMGQGQGRGGLNVMTAKWRRCHRKMENAGDTNAPPPWNNKKTEMPSWFIVFWKLFSYS